MSARPEPGRAAGPDAAAPGDRLLALVTALVAELRPRAGSAPPVHLDSALERELGLDSLARAELLLRIEREMGVALPERVLAEAETPRDLLRALSRGGGPRTAGTSEDATVAPSAPLASAEAAPQKAATLLAALAWHRSRHPERRHLLFVEGDGGGEELTYAELGKRAEAVAASLLARGLAPGDAVALMLPSCTEYFAVFLGIQLAGGVPVPLYPPARRSQVEDHLRRQARILVNARARLLVAAAEVRPLARLVSPLAPELRAIVSPAELLAGGGRALLPPVSADDVAFLQFTSGSTGDPKGVVLTHANLLANLRAAGRALELGGDDVVVSWLPLYHDMGLIGAWMGSLYFGLPLVLMSPLTFLARPVRWLQAISRHRGTITAAPNFGYALCARKVSDEEIAALDLSRWRVALNGAEPVSAEVVEAFARRFAPAGFRAEAMMPVYGLAEATLAVAFTPLGRGPRIERVERRAFQELGEARPVRAGTEPGESGDGAPLAFVSCGLPVPGHEVRVVDDAGRELPERREGSLQVRGPSVTSGYHRNPQATARLLRDGWLETGDLGYVAGGEVFVTGRSKDLILRAGRNVHPEELEEAVGALGGVRKGCVAVFATAGREEGTERLVVMAELARGLAAGSQGGARGDAQAGEREALRRRIGELAIDLTGAAADEVVLAPPGSVPKTSSGKIRRSTARELYEHGRVGPAARGRHDRALWWQLGRLAGASLPGRLRRLRRRTAELAYGAWCWTATLAVGLPTYAAVMVLPGLAARRRAARAGARLLALAAGCRIRAAGLGGLPAGPCVVVSNHQSYVDGFLLSAVLPPRYAFVVKAELAGSALARLPLRRLGALFVERRAAEKGAEEARRAAAALGAGESLVVFSEGTFRRAPGLLPFRMGAFVSAAQAAVPVVPLAVRGTRSLLRAGTWLPRRAAVSVEALGPILAAGAEWREAVALRDATREAILAHAAEPDLGGEELTLPPA
jgi:1-acyl-sn-glycerol-3-phosphate acyltransferase